MSSFLLDTHTLLWAISDVERLGAKALQVLSSTEQRLFFSMASYWELCIKISIGKLRLAANWRESIEREMRALGISWMPIKRAHVEGIIELPWHHRDPFDRLLISQARAERLTMLSADKVFTLYDIDCCF